MTDTGTTNIGTFWFAWSPAGYNFLPSVPSAEANPTGWTNTPTGSGNQFDGTGIQWVASSNPITAGNSLSGFTFSTTDSPAVLAEDSPSHPGNASMLSEVYSAGIFSDVGFAFTVTPAAVSLASSTTTLISSQPTIAQGGSVMFTATVVPTSGSGTDPGGTVTFLNNGSSIGSAPVQSGGAATLTTTTLPAGSLSITAEYSGDSNYSTSTSAAITQVVNAPAPTTTTLGTSQATVQGGSSVTITATVAPATPSGSVPTGTVTFNHGSTTLGTIAVQSDGTAQLITTSLPIGADSITAVYSGDENFATSTAAPITKTVTPGSSPTTTTLTTSATSIHVGDDVTFIATVAAVTPGGAIPTGTVTFTQDGTVLGSTAVQSDGTAAFSSTTLPLESDNIIATYSGDVTYAASASTALVESVTTPPTLVPSIAKSTLSVNRVAGIAAHGNVTFDLTNNTVAALKGKITLQLFASTTGVIDSSALTLLSVVRSVNVKTTKPAAITIGIKIAAAAVPVGTYTLLARVVDLASNNNDSVPGPTLAVAAPFVALSEIVTKSNVAANAISGAKSRASVTVKITNSGNVTTTGKTTVALFASASGVVDDAAVQINSVIKPLRIAANKSATVSLPLKLIPAIAAGDYTIIARVTDSNGVVSTVMVGVLSITTA